MPRAVRRALDAMRASPEHAFTLGSLADLTQTPPRTLQRQFADFVGKGPLEALRDIRFEAARRLLQASAPGAKVSELAARVGLTHQGRFSVEYRRRYGETPSDTLGRRERIRSVAPVGPRRLNRRDEIPTVAVIPVEAGGEDAALAGGITAAMQEALNRSGLQVTANASGARYHLAGAFRSSGGLGRLSYRLVDRETGRLVWAHRHDGACEDAFLLEDNLATRVASAIQPSLRSEEVARARAKPDRDARPYDLAMRALPHVLSFDGDAIERALDLLERALELDPEHPLASALAAWCHGQRVVYRFTPQPFGAARPAVKLAQQAIAPESDATTLAIAGAALNAAHDLDAAGQAIKRALEIDGGSAWAWGRSAWIDVYSGEPRSAIGRFATAMELAPHDPLVFNYHHGLGCAHFHLGEFEQSVAAFERGIAEQPSAVWAHRMICPAYVLAGDHEKARASLRLVRQLYPDFTISQVAAAIPLPAATLDKVGEALESLGVPA